MHNLIKYDTELQILDSGSIDLIVVAVYCHIFD